jgi:peptidoglycan-associated lipoprotein
MMNKKFVVSVIMAMFLAACASKPIEEPKAPMKESSPPPAQTQEAPPADTSNSGATTTPAMETKAEVNPLKDPNNILSTRSIYFDYDKDEVKSEYRALVEAHAKYLVEHPNAKLVLQGNTDDRGSREYNLALGQRRSAAVRKVMNVLGASDTQIETVSYGKEKPRCSDQAEACWAQNRRVDIVYDGE